MPESTKDCLECRLISGFGLLGISVYIYYQAKHRKQWESYAMRTLSAGVFMLGGARLFNLSFLKAAKE